MRKPDFLQLPKRDLVIIAIVQRVLPQLVGDRVHLEIERTNEGCARAMAECVRFGRRPKLTKHQAREALKRVAAGETLRMSAAA